MNRTTFFVPLGRNGSGKGTVANLLGKTGAHVYTMSDILKEAKTQPEIGPVIGRCMKNEDRVPCPIVCGAFKEHFRKRHVESSQGSIFIYDGACRSETQVDMKLGWMRKRFPDVSIVIGVLDVSHEVAMKRICKRYQDALKNKQNPRVDDIPEIAEKRSLDYSAQEPLIVERAKLYRPDEMFRLNYDKVSPYYAAARILNLVRPMISLEEAQRIIIQTADC